MNKKIEAGKVFQLADLVPYEKGKINHMGIAHDDNMKFFVMAFDDDQELPAHKAPGEALAFALEGKAIITYEGKDYPIKAGENFSMAAGALHSVKAQGKFKMALFLISEK